jgi:hypothetical protein
MCLDSKTKTVPCGFVSDVQRVLLLAGLRTGCSNSVDVDRKWPGIANHPLSPSFATTCHFACPIRGSEAAGMFSAGRATGLIGAEGGRELE